MVTAAFNLALEKTTEMGKGGFKLLPLYNTCAHQMGGNMAMVDNNFPKKKERHLWYTFPHFWNASKAVL